MKQKYADLPDVRDEKNYRKMSDIWKSWVSSMVLCYRIGHAPASYPKINASVFIAATITPDAFFRFQAQNDNEETKQAEIAKPKSGRKLRSAPFIKAPTFAPRVSSSVISSTTAARNQSGSTSNVCDQCQYPKSFAAIEQHLTDQYSKCSQLESARAEAEAQLQDVGVALNMAEEEINSLKRDVDMLENWVISLMTVIKQRNGQLQLDRMGLDDRSKWEALESSANAAMIASANYTQLAQPQNDANDTDGDAVVNEIPGDSVQNPVVIVDEAPDFGDHDDIDLTVEDDEVIQNTNFGSFFGKFG